MKRKKKEKKRVQSGIIIIFFLTFVFIKIEKEKKIYLMKWFSHSQIKEL